MGQIDLDPYNSPTGEQNGGGTHYKGIVSKDVTDLDDEVLVIFTDYDAETEIPCKWTEHPSEPHFPQEGQSVLAVVDFDSDTYVVWWG